MKEIDNENATKANTTIDNVYKIHTDNNIEHDPSKPITTSMREKERYCVYTQVKFS